MASLHQQHIQDNGIEKMTADEYLPQILLNRKENIIITGASGTGKSYLAQALGYQACLMDNRVLYTNTAKLTGRLKLSKVDGTYLKELSKIRKVDVLILDDFGLTCF